MTILISPRQGSSLKLGPSQIFSLESNVGPFEKPIEDLFIYPPKRNLHDCSWLFEYRHCIWITDLHFIVDYWIFVQCRLDHGMVRFRKSQLVGMGFRYGSSYFREKLKFLVQKDKVKTEFQSYPWIKILFTLLIVESFCCGIFLSRHSQKNILLWKLNFLQ